MATEVTSDKEIVATRSMYWDKRQTKDIVRMRDGHSNIGSTLTGTIWMVPEGSTGGGFDSWVLISNPQETDIEVDLTFMTQAGPLNPVLVTIPAKSRYTVRVSDYVPNDFHVSTLAESVDEIVVERAMYWDRREFDGIQPYEMMGGHSASGVDP